MEESRDFTKVSNYLVVQTALSTGVTAAFSTTNVTARLLMNDKLAGSPLCEINSRWKTAKLRSHCTEQQIAPGITAAENEVANAK